MWPFKKKQKEPDYKTEVLANVLTKLYMREMYENSKGYKVGGDKESIGQIVTREFEIINNFRLAKGHSTEDVEHLFYCPEFVKEYINLSLEEKHKRLDSLVDQEFANFVKIGIITGAGKTENPIVHYLTKVAFDNLEYNLPLP